MTRDEITEIVATAGSRHVAASILRKARAAIGQLDLIDVAPIRARHKAALLAGDMIGAREPKEQIAFMEANAIGLRSELEALIPEAEARERGVEKPAAAMRKLQQRGIEVGAEIHDAAERLCALIAEHVEIEGQLRVHNDMARSCLRADLTVTLPLELLAMHLGVHAISLKDPREWVLDGYYPVPPRHDDGQVRFDRFRDLLTETKRAA